MNISRLSIFIICLACTSTLFSQEFNVEDQYSQALRNAKIAFEANQYSQAVMFYNEAISIKPKALLPKYKIEDIRTIYIKNELVSLKKVQEPIAVKKPSKKQQKEIEAKNIILEEKAAELATKKMMDEAQIAKEELKSISVELEVLNIDEEEVALNEETIENTSPDRQVSLNVIDSKESSKIVTTTNTSHEMTLTVEKQKLPVTPIIEDTKIETPIIKKEVKPVKPKVNVIIINNEFIEKENQRLVEKYPNKKTVETIEKPGKIITRVVMNIDQKVTVYLKVKHGWGATYYFIEEIGFEPKSVSGIYFNRMTDLTTTEYNSNN